MTSVQLERESERLKTFETWECDFIDPRVLAKAGFYYRNVEDSVQCVFCGIQIRGWEPGDDPDQDHRENSPNCDFVRNRECGNVPITDVGAQDTPMENVCSQDVSVNNGVEISNGEGYVLFFTGTNGRTSNLQIAENNEPVCPYYSTKEKRIESFDSWTKSEIQLPEKLADAGFYFTKIGDSTVCFHCGGGLHNWTEHDDPWVEHAKHFPKCGFVVACKDEEFIENSITKNALLLSPETSRSLLIAMYKGKKNEYVASGKEIGAFVAPGANPKVEPAASSCPDAEETALCRICCMKEKCIAFLPCGHLICCENCAESLKEKCGVCRRTIQKTIRVYLS